MNKLQKPGGVNPLARPLSEQEKQARIIQFLQQKREAFSINILQGLCTNMGKDATNRDAKEMVALSVEMADALLEKLYPIKDKEEGK